MMPATRTIAALARDRCRNPQGRRNVKKRKTNLPKSASYTKEMCSQRTTDGRRGVADLGQAAALQYQNPASFWRGVGGGVHPFQDENLDHPTQLRSPLSAS